MKKINSSCIPLALLLFLGFQMIKLFLYPHFSIPPGIIPEYNWATLGIFASCCIVGALLSGWLADLVDFIAEERKVRKTKHNFKDRFKME